MTATATDSPRQPPKTTLRAVALPAEHGGWGFLIEPVIAGLILAPSAAALWLSAAALFAYLLHQPLKTSLKDRQRGRRYARTGLAERVAFAYAAATALAFTAACLTAPHPFWMPLLAAVPLAGVQFWYELHNEGRETLSEFAGALAFTSITPMMLLMTNEAFDLPRALALGGVWLALAARVVPSILYVRARLRLEKGQIVDPRPANRAHLAAVLVLALLMLSGMVTPLVLLGGIMLLGRSILGLSARRKPVQAKVIGFHELAYGLLYAILLGVGGRL